MAVKVKKCMSKSPSTGTIRCFYKQTQTKNVGMEKILKEVSEKCTLTRADLEGIVSELGIQIIDQIKDGNRVKLHLLGIFSPSLHAFSQSDPQKVTGDTIKYVTLCFRQSTWLRDRLIRENLEFEDVTPKA